MQISRTSFSKRDSKMSLSERSYRPELINEFNPSKRFQCYTLEELAIAQVQLCSELTDEARPLKQDSIELWRRFATRGWLVVGGLQRPSSKPFYHSRKFQADPSHRYRPSRSLGSSSSHRRTRQILIALLPVQMLMV